MRVHLPYPVSVNRMYRNLSGRGRVKATVYKEWIKAATAELADAKLPYYQDKVILVIYVKRPDKRRRDISNLIKGVEDFLVSRGILKDDHLVEDVRAVWVYSGPEGCQVYLRAA